MRVLVTGATGNLGGKVVTALQSRGHEAVGLSRRPGPDLRVGNITTGEGIAKAVADVGAIVHAASDPMKDPKSTDVEGTRRLASFGIPLLFVSIVGVDQSTYRYYRYKVAGEQVLKNSGAPWSVLRATQFHEFIDMLLTMSRSAGAKLPWRNEQNASVLFPRDWQFGPTSSTEVAEYIAGMIERGPTQSIEQFGGPQRFTSAELADSWAAVRGGRPKFIPTFGRVAKGFRNGVTIPENPDGVGVTTWDEYLASAVSGPR